MPRRTRKDHHRRNGKAKDQICRAVKFCSKIALLLQHSCGHSIQYVTEPRAQIATPKEDGERRRKKHSNRKYNAEGCDTVCRVFHVHPSASPLAVDIRPL